MATVYDVAKEAKVSIATVSRVFNESNSVSESTQHKVRLAADKLNYFPHLGARSLVGKLTDTIGIVLPEMHGEFFSELVKGFDAAARQHGLHLLLSCSHDNAEEMAAALSAMRGRVDGVIVMSALINADAYQKNIPKDMPIVVLNGGRQNKRYATVSLDNYSGALEMTEHLLKEGHRHIALISGPANNQDAEQRKLGYLRALETSVEECQPDIVDGDFSEACGYAVGVRIMSRNTMPDAVFASNDAMAIGCLSAFLDHGISVPGDIALAGFDDISLARYVRPSLSSVGVPIAELGTKSLEVLLGKINPDTVTDSPDEFLFAPSLRIRDSTRKAPTPSAPVSSKP